jgi:orotidine-5'-phosphate decarboxylase
VETFGSRLTRARAQRGPLCVGVDPHASLLARWGLTDDADGLARFSATVVAALAERVAVFKPQSAFYERFGARGIAVLESTIRQLRDAGALVLLDVKRGDIGSTMAAYASAYLDPTSPLYADAITASPYLGVGSLGPLLDAAAAHRGGAFVLAFTSNPEGAQFQRAVTADGRTVGQTVIDEISQLNVGARPLGSIGVVLGATVAGGPVDIAALNGPVLVPGMGAQGGTPDSLRAAVGDVTAGVLPSYSRELLTFGPGVPGLRDAADRARAACAAALAPSI